MVLHRQKRKKKRILGKSYFHLRRIIIPECSDAQLCLTLCNLIDCSWPGSSVHWILPTRILEWVAISSSRGSSTLRDQSWVSSVFCMSGECKGKFFTTSVTWKAQLFHIFDEMFIFFLKNFFNSSLKDSVRGNFLNAISYPHIDTSTIVCWDMYVEVVFFFKTFVLYCSLSIHAVGFSPLFHIAFYMDYRLWSIHYGNSTELNCTETDG